MGRRARIDFHVSPIQKEHIYVEAASRDMSVSEFCRWATLGHVAESRNREQMRAHMYPDQAYQESLYRED
jgi:hypothetical protein